MRTGSESTALTAAGLDDPEWTESVCRHTDARDERDRTQTTTEARLRSLSHTQRETSVESYRRVRLKRAENEKTKADKRSF